MLFPQQPISTQKPHLVLDVLNLKIRCEKIGIYPGASTSNKYKNTSVIVNG